MSGHALYAALLTLVSSLCPGPLRPKPWLVGRSVKLSRMAPIRWLGLVVGALILAGPVASTFSTLVMPRA